MAEPGRRFRTTRKDGRFVSTAGFVHDLTKRTEPALAFDAALCRREMAAWRRRVRGRLDALLALPDRAPAASPKLLGAARRRGYALQRWEFYPEPGAVVPALVLVPDTATTLRPAPGVLCFPGTDYSKELMAGEREGKRTLAGYHQPPPEPDKQRMGRHYARAGFVAVCVDNPGTQAANDPVCPGRTELCMQLLRLGRNYQGLCVHHGRVLFDWLRAQPFVDAKRIAASGHSLGSTRALLLSVVERRIAAVVHNGHVGSWRESAIATGMLQSPLWHVVPGMERWFDRADLCAALAPRPLLISEGASPEAADTVRGAYALAKAAGGVEIVYSPKYTAQARRAKPRGPLAEGLTREALKRRTFLDSSFHYFKPEIAVPWLRDALRAR